VALSVTGTLYTDILTDREHVPLALSTTVFAAILAVVFGVWWVRERTLSIHSIVTFPREAFYWLAILVTFALGTAAGDWTLELTGWAPGTSVLLPLGLILAIVAGWRLGANAVLAFWLAYIMTRPLGANLGDWLANARADHGLGLGTAGTTVVFLLAILATVIYLTVTGVDSAAARGEVAPDSPRQLGRERAMLAYFAAVAAITAVVLAAAHARPHGTAVAAEADAPATTTIPGATTTTAAPGALIAKFPAADVANLRTITADTLAKLDAGDQAGATRRVKDLETTWDADQSSLLAKDPKSWHVLDGQIDTVLTALRAPRPDTTQEHGALRALLASLT
jgi:Na+-transporting methylmalonyl-CoA/oxaloacetate decarboxylase gamma subunit